MIEDKVYTEMMKRVHDKLDLNEKCTKDHSTRLYSIEQEIIGMKKDTGRLEEIMDKLERAIESLNATITEIKLQPLKRYEQIAMMIITLVVGFLFARITR